MKKTLNLRSTLRPSLLFASIVLFSLHSAVPVVVLKAADCDGNGIDDAEDIAEGRRRDCNADGIPDGCQGQSLRFATPKRHEVNSAGQSRALALLAEDLNGDGHVDILILRRDTVGVDETLDKISILRGLGDRKFAVSVDHALDFRAGYPIYARDFDGDGDLDLMLRESDVSSAVVVLENRGDGHFAVLGKHSIPTESMGFFPSDLDSDGDLDVAVGLGSFQVSDTGEILLLVHREDGTLEPGKTLETTGLFGNLAAGDLDSDGRPELIIARSSGGPAVGVLRNLGGWEFAEAEFHDPGPGAPPWSLEVADLDRDGDPDLAAASLDSVALLFNDGSGAFPEARRLGRAYVSSLLGLGDFNGDGWLDIGAVGGAFYFGLGQGLFADVVFFGDGSLGGYRAVADLDADGHADLVVEDSESGHIQLQVLYGRADDGVEAPRVYSTSPAPNLGPGAPLLLRGGDLDGDGDLDLVVANQRSSQTEIDGIGKDEVWIFENRGDARFQTPARLELPLHSQQDLVCRDLDGDGDLDLASCGSWIHEDSKAGFAVLLNQGDGRFSNAVFYEMPAGSRRRFPIRMTAVDLNGDGHQELVTTNATAGDVAILWNLRGGAFGEVQTILPPDGARYSMQQGIVGADFDGDGDADLALLHNGWWLDAGLPEAHPTITVFLSDPDFRFAERREVFTEGLGISLAVGDMTGDGIPDLVVGYRGSPYYRLSPFHVNSIPPSVAMLEGLGDGDFKETERIPFPGPSVSLWDVDRDGDLDVVGTGEQFIALADRESMFRTDSVAILFNRGDGRLGGLVEIESERTVVSAVADDLSGDGMVDLAVLNYASRQIAVYENNADATAPCGQKFLRADVNANASVELQDGLRLLQYLFLVDPHLACRKAADIDDNGRIELTDPLYLLNYLFLGGSTPPEPFGGCGEDPTADGLECAMYPWCR